MRCITTTKSYIFDLQFSPWPEKTISNAYLHYTVISFIFQFDDDDFDPDADDDETFEKEFSMHKRDYYIKKLKYPEMTPYDNIKLLKFS